MKLGLKLFPYKHLKFILDQSWMDHELVGHMWNYLEWNRHHEVEAIQAQVDWFKMRSWIKWKGLYWWILSKVWRIILDTHKKEDLEREENNL